MTTGRYSSGARVTIVTLSRSHLSGGRDVRTHRYRITIAGGLGQIGREAFADMMVEVEPTFTVLSGDLDQRGLHALLDRVRALGLELVGVRQAPPSI